MLWTWIKNADDDHSYYNALYFTTIDIKSKQKAAGEKDNLNFCQKSEGRLLLYIKSFIFLWLGLIFHYHSWVAGT